ncbi:unnamed protein product [Ostreobium quekettii]|uniref:1-phosphatidylinositol 4-kinase n=1 Tax=Ostreobium quekettii TaxID=121088 RepID=A0A8S1J0X2_9CHLO|nr:unnamed protein product [Ostreobium quekettii]
MNRMKPRPSQTAAKGRTDLLLRLFDSQFFDAWLALTYIYRRETSAGVQDYLCNKLHDLPEHDLERYLSQFCQLIACKPGGSLERVLVDLCSRSLRLAVKVFWLFKAISQDPKYKHVAEVLDKCEKAALNGSWELPFKDPALQPLSPNSEDISSGGALFSHALSARSHGKLSQDGLDDFHGSGANSSPYRESSPETPRPFSPMGGGSPSLCSSIDMGQGLEGLIGSSNPYLKGLVSECMEAERLPSQELSVDTDMSSSANFERCRMLRQELGEGEGVTALLEKSCKNAAQCGSGLVIATEDEVLDEPPSSPRLRQTTFGATLDFIDALCDASSGLVHIAQEARLKALCRGLCDINNEIDYCSRNSVAVYFPMCEKNERIVRLVPNEVVLLNSREKAPFLLLIEVLQTDKDGERTEADEVDGELSDQYADSAHSLMARTESHIQAGPGPGSKPPMGPVRAVATRDADAPGSSAARGMPPMCTGRSLSESSASRDSLGDHRAATGRKGLPRLQGSVLGNSSAGTVPADLMLTPKNSFTRRLDRAMTSLRGDGPLVRVKVKVMENADEVLRAAAERQQTDSEEQWTALGGVAGSEVEGSASGSLSSSKTLSLLSRIGLCRTPCLDLGIGEEWYSLSRSKKDEDKVVTVNLEVVGGLNLHIPPPSKRNRRVPSQEAIELVADKCKVDSIPPPALSGPLAFNPYDTRSWSEASVATGIEMTAEEKQALKRQKRAKEVYGQRWVDKVAAVRRQSPHGRRKGWQLRCVIVKSGDDCRQELMAVQLIRVFQDIFHEAKLPLWLRPYDVLVTSNRTALIEFIPDALSIHSIKHRSRPGTSLSQHFFDKFRKGTPECAAAQRNFVESMAAYSLYCYLLQVKDRHNSNLMLDDDGHIIHIDFGFMLSNSPGGVNFEAAPFKLTREFLEVMDSNSEGKASELFDYFKVLCIKGFLACRKHSDRIILLCEMMLKAGFPCFKTGERALKALNKRFHLNYPEEQCVQVVLGLISDSLDSWRTRQYDYYQRVLNGIL